MRPRRCGTSQRRPLLVVGDRRCHGRPVPASPPGRQQRSTSRTPPDPSVAVVSGGVGAARFLRGLLAVVPPERIAAIVNTGDDTVLHGLSISPDLDTITYTLADAIDPDRGWGLAGETWHAMEALARYEPVRPAGSDAATTWFGLGDRDLATHLYRTARRAEGATSTEIADEVRRAWGLAIRLLPMTDDPLATIVELATGEDVSFQDYFVRLRHGVPVRGVHFAGDAVATSAAIAALTAADVVVIAPSNPVVSIGPVRSLPGIDELLGSRRSTVVAVSPIVGGVALKGPADRMLVELGHEPSVVGVARLYAPVAGALVIDTVDADLAPQIEAAGMRAVVAPSIMSTPQIAAELARTTLAAAG
ncbi:MAG: 2-phospho-L-lactate transferase [Ilumatobacteraceae bacterium]